jgi:hypothetical protein
MELGIDAIMAQGGQEGERAPAAMGARHVGLGPGFVIDGDEARRIKLSLMPFPAGAATHHVRPT